MFVPVIYESCFVIWTNDQDLCLEFDEVLIVPAQLRHVPAAEWSKESPVEDKQNVFLTLEL
jgi:hypothetical protein